MENKEIIKRLYTMLGRVDYNEIDDPLNIGLLIEDIHEATAGAKNMTSKKIESITINAKEWFDKVNGNSYFSARILINDKEVTVLPFQYGYGDHYEDMANKWLDENKFIDNPRHSNGTRSPLWGFCRDRDIHYVPHKQSNCLKRELDKK